MSESPRLSRRAALAALASAPLVVRAAGADPPETSRSPAKPSSVAGETIAARLAKASWRTAGRGPLLLVAPEAIDNSVVENLPPVPPGGDRVIELAPLLDRKLTRVGSLWTLTPTTSPWPPGLPAYQPGELSRDSNHAALALLAGLGDSAAKLATPLGIGRDDIRDPTLKRHFARMRPWRFRAPIRLLSEANLAAIRQPTDIPDPAVVAAYTPNTLLPASLEHTMRLRAYWNVFLQLRISDRVIADLRYDSRHRGTEPIDVCWLPSQAWIAPDELPFAPRPSDLAFSSDALNPIVDLTGAQTVGELVERIARVCRLNLIAEARLARYSVQTRGESARAGDVLDALCRALCGAIRRLPPTEPGGRSLFLLAEDQIPRLNREQIAELRSAIAELSRTAPLRAAAARAQETLRKRGVDSLPIPLPEWLTGDLRDLAFAPTDLLDTIHRQEYLDRSPLGVDNFALDQLPAKILADVRAAVRNAELPARATLAITATLNIEALLPAIEGRETAVTLEPSQLFGLHATAPITLPAAIAHRTLLTRPPRGDDEARALADAAKRSGFTEISVALGGDPARDADITALARLANDRGLGFVPTLIPVAATPQSSPDDRERDMFNRTMAGVADSPEMVQLARLSRPYAHLRDWLRETDALRVEAVDFDALAKRLTALAALPGVTGIGLEYVHVMDQNTDADDTDRVWCGGLSLLDRRRFVEQYQIDPADGGKNNSYSPALAAIADDETLGKLWNDWCAGRQRRFAARLASALDTVRPRVPIRLLPRPRVLPGVQSLDDKVWEDYHGIVSLTPAKSDVDQAAQQRSERPHLTFDGGVVASLGEVHWLYSAIPDDSQLDAAMLRSLSGIFAGVQWRPAYYPDGVVLDLTDRSLDDVVRFVTKHFQPPATAATTFAPKRP